MKLHFLKRYKSIKQLEDTDLPSFTVLTGKNGSGKTHLLKAIAGVESTNQTPQDIKISIESISEKTIKYFNFQEFIINSQQSTQKSSIDALKEEAWNFLLSFKQYIAPSDIQLTNILGNLDKPYYINEADIAPENIENYHHFIKIIKQEIDTRTDQKPILRGLLKSFMIYGDDYFSTVDRNNFINRISIEIEDYSLSLGLSEIFFAYKQKLNISQLEEKSGGLGMDNDAIRLLEEQSPWKLINDMLIEFKMEHRVNEPTFTSADQMNSNPDFICRLALNDELIDFNDLSSGEKILCALAITIYQGGGHAEFPKLMLLDEVDASLHPSMMINLIDVIKNVFLNKGCAVILATHSPTTVSLVSDEELFEVKKEDTPKKIVKISRSAAVELLSEGMMTLEKAVTFINDVFKKEITIISEGKNRDHIKQAIFILRPDLSERIDIYSNNHEGGSGDADISGLFNFVSIAKHDKAALFVVDCDSDKFISKQETNNTFHYTFIKNTENVVSIKGIENLYPETFITNEFCNNRVFKKDNQNKTQFLKAVVANTDTNTFVGFIPLINKIESILNDVKT